MLYFFLKEKTKTYFNTDNLELILLRFLLLLISCIYGLSGSLMLSIAPVESLNKIITLINFIIILLILFRNILPIYNKKRKIIPSYFPVSNFKRTIVDFIDAAYTPLITYLIVFTFSLSLSPFYNLKELIITCIVVLNALLLELSLKKVLDEDLDKKFYHLLLVIIAIVFLGFNLTAFAMNNLLIILLINGVLSFFLKWYLEGVYVFIYKVSFPQKKAGRSAFYTFISLLFTRSSIKIALLVAIIFKILFISVNVLSYSRKGYFLFNSEFLLYLFLSPVIYFTYIFNNYFGYTKEYWLIFNLSQNKKILLLAFFIPLLFILFFDLSISILAMSYMSMLSILSLIKYFFLTLVLSLNALLTSFFLPKKISSEFSFDSFKNNTSVIASFISFGFVSVLFLDSNFIQIILFFIIFIIQSIILLISFNKNHTNMNYSFFKKIF